MACTGSRVGLVVVSYNPDPVRFKRVLAASASQIDCGVVVDNGSANLAAVREVVPAGFQLVENPTNLGVGVALNQGVSQLLDHYHPNWILTLDDDTIIAPDYVPRLLAAVRALGSARRIGIITAELPQHSTQSGRLRPRGYVYTTANLVCSAVFSKARFREDFFVDQVDHDFCFEVRSKGYEILVLDQRLYQSEHGLEARLIGRLVRYEPCRRYYYIVRNSTVLLREGRLPLGLYLRQLTQWGFLAAMCESQRGTWESLASGLKDGLDWTTTRDHSTDR